ncbi:MAG TPA: sortase [Gryllotalpicola sp.]
MTATDAGLPGTRRDRRPTQPVWEPAPVSQQILSAVLYLAGGALFFLLANLLLVTPVVHYASQHNLYGELRLTLADGAIPVNSLDSAGKPTAAGTPIGLMKAPGIGVRQEVIVEGSAAAQTAAGIGHRRDTVYPCQIGSSVLMARDGAYGGIGQRWKKLQPGDTFTVTMGQGGCTYRVLDQRTAGQNAPPPPSGTEGRLVLTTAAGLHYLPTDVVRVDAQLITTGYKHALSSVPTAAVPEAEQAMGSQLRAALKHEPGVDLATPFGMILLLEVLVAAGIATAWLWKRWGRWETWIVSAPVLLTVGLLIAGQAGLWFLPNLI